MRSIDKGPQKYKADPPPNNPQDFATYMGRELGKVENAVNQPAQDEILYAEPTKIKPGMRVYADGVSWNPGSGEGLYRRNVSNTLWVFVG